MTPESLSKSIGANIVLARKARRLTQSELASRALISRQSIAQIEKGIPSKYLLQVVWALGLDEQLVKALSPASDEVGRSLAFGSLPKRVSKRKEGEWDDEFE